MYGKAIEVVHSYLVKYDGSLPYRYKTIETLQDFKNLILHYFYYLYEEEIINFKENLKSDVAKDLFNLISKDWQEVMVLFVIERFNYLEKVFVPFKVIRNHFNLKEFKSKKNGEEYISLEEAINKVLNKLKTT